MCSILSNPDLFQEAQTQIYIYVCISKQGGRGWESNPVAGDNREYNNREDNNREVKTAKQKPLSNNGEVKTEKQKPRSNNREVKTVNT